MSFSGAEQHGCRRLVRLVTFVVAAVALAGPVFVAVESARSMVAIQNGTGYPGDRVQARVQNQQTGPYAPWQITAPPNTRIVTAAGSNPGGTVAFNCVIGQSGTSVTCRPPNNVRWAAGNVVTLGLEISPTAPAGTYSGTSSMPWESGQYTVTVLPPPAPNLTSPADGTESLETQPVISGTKLAGHSVQAFVDGAPACIVPADGATSWQCTPARELTPGPHQITATQTSPGGSTSAVSTPHSYEVTQLAALSLSIGEAEGRPGARVPITARLRNGGPGIAENPRIRINFGSLTAGSCRIDDRPLGCETLADGVDIADMASGAIVTVTATAQIPDNASNNQSYPVRGMASAANAETAPVEAAGAVTARRPSVTPPPRPTPPRPPVIRTPPAPDALPTPRLNLPRPATPPEAQPPAEREQPRQTDRPRRPSGDVSLPRASTPLPINFSTGLQPIKPGTARTFVGSIGPFEGTEPAKVVISGRIDRGLWLRGVTVEPGGDCEVTAREFTCSIVLEPGQVATMSTRVFADAGITSPAANLQLKVNGDPDQFDNMKTASIRLDNGEKSSGLFGAAKGPIGLPAILLALFLLALAAHAESGRRTADDPDGGSS